MGVSGQQHAPAALYPRGKTRYPFYRRLGGPPGPVWTGGEPRPHRDSIPDRPARSQSLHQLSYRAHMWYMRRLFSTRPASSSSRPFYRRCYPQLSYGHQSNTNGFLVWHMTAYNQWTSHSSYMWNPCDYIRFFENTS